VPRPFADTVTVPERFTPVGYSAAGQYVPAGYHVPQDTVDPSSAGRAAADPYPVRGHAAQGFPALDYPALGYPDETDAYPPQADEPPTAVRQPSLTGLPPAAVDDGPSHARTRRDALGRGGPGDSGHHRTSPRRRSRTASVLAGVGEVVVVVGLALVLALVVKTFLVQAFYIPSESMERTLLVGDRVLVSKLTPGPFDLRRGDIVVFKDPGGWLTPQAEPDDGAFRTALRATLTFVGLLPQDSGEHLIKRVIGLPGDRVACCDSAGRMTVNGTALDETYLQPGIDPSAKTFTVTVPAGRMWVQGDNRPFSQDSRYNMTLPGGGTVPLSDVVGKAFVVVWPLDRAGGLGAPDSVFSGVPAGGG
jgi:signal peptidase I